MRRVVVTGAGLVTPAGVGRRCFDGYLENGLLCIDRLSTVAESASPIQVGGRVPGLVMDDFVPLRLAKRCDRFTHLALVAAQLCIEDAQLALDREDAGRIGVMIGNNLGGWQFGQQGLYDLYRAGPSAVSPYQASAWFPAAAQGQISIRYGFRGYSKTVVADRASGLAAVAAAVRAIRLDHCDVIVAGGAEAPLAHYALLCYLSAGELSLVADPASAFLPFDSRRAGLVLAEGAALLALEERERALRRGAPILGEIVSYGMAGGAGDDVLASGPPEVLARAMTTAMERARWVPEEVDYVCADGSGMATADPNECEAIRAALGHAANRVPVSCPKSGLGHMLGAAGPADVYAALKAIADSRVPPTLGLRFPDASCGVPLVGPEPLRRSVRNVLVNAQGRGGVGVCLAVTGAHGESASRAQSVVTAL